MRRSSQYGRASDSESDVLGRCSSYYILKVGRIRLQNPRGDSGEPGSRTEVSALVNKHTLFFPGIGKILTQPTLGSKAPAMTAPSERPTVMPVFANPMKRPRRFALTIWITTIVATIRIPAPPAPVKERPTKNQVKEFARDVISEPAQMSVVEKNMHMRGLKTCESRPISGARADMAIRYEEVNHVASSKESRSAAMDDWVVVRMEILAPVVDEHAVRSPAVRAESKG